MTILRPSILALTFLIIIQTSFAITNNPPKTKTNDTETFASRKEASSEVVEKVEPAPRKNSKKTKPSGSTSATSKSPQIAPYPAEDPSSPHNSNSNSNSEEKKDDAPQSLVLELLDDHEKESQPEDREIHEHEEKFPRVYYGEVPEENSRHSPDYPKSYVNSKQKKNPSGSGSHSNKKKRYEYKYHHQDDAQGHSVPIYELDHHHHQNSPQSQGQGQGHGHGVEEEEPRFGNGNQGDGYEHFGGMKQDGPEEGYQREGYGPASPGHFDGGRYPPHGQYYHGPGSLEFLNKALHMLIPSAILLTGLSAVFPNRVHVPTNDFNRPNNNNYNVRNKRSLSYLDTDNSLSLHPEHRLLDEDDGISLDFEPEPLIEPTTKPALEKKPYNYEISRGRLVHYNRIQHIMSEADSVAPKTTTTTTSKPKKLRSKTKILRKIRKGNRRVSRPLPKPETRKVLEPQIPPFKALPSPASSFMPGDEYLKSIVEDKRPSSVDRVGVDLSPDSPVMGLITSYAHHDRDSPSCQKRALCEMAIKGKTATASKFETFLWSLATLVPDQFSKLYDLDEIFAAVKGGGCDVFRCSEPNFDLQVK